MSRVGARKTRAISRSPNVPRNRKRCSRGLPVDSPIAKLGGKCRAQSRNKVLLSIVSLSPFPSLFHLPLIVKAEGAFRQRCNVSRIAKYNIYIYIRTECNVYRIYTNSTVYFLASSVNVHVLYTRNEKRVNSIRVRS